MKTKKRKKNVNSYETYKTQLTHRSRVSLILYSFRDSGDKEFGTKSKSATLRCRKSVNSSAEKTYSLPVLLGSVGKHWSKSCSGHANQLETFTFSFVPRKTVRHETGFNDIFMPIDNQLEGIVLDHFSSP